MAKTTNMGRRALLQSFPAAALAVTATGVAAFGAPVAPAAQPHDPIPGWYEEFIRFEREWERLEEDTPEGNVAWARREEMALKIATTPAISLAGLKAQVAWFNHDLGDHVRGGAGDPYSCAIDVIQSGLEGLI